MTSRAYGARSPHSQYDVILIVTSFATELATPAVTDVRTLCTDTLPHLIYRDEQYSCCCCSAYDAPTLSSVVGVSAGSKSATSSRKAVTSSQKTAAKVHASSDVAGKVYTYVTLSLSAVERSMLHQMLSRVGPGYPLFHSLPRLLLFLW